MGVSEVFEEWDVYATRRQLIPRRKDLETILSSSTNKIVSLTGIRRCGKSSLLMLLRQRLKDKGEKSAYINLEDYRLKGVENPLDSVIKWFGDEGTLLLDEITAIHDYEGWLSRIHELLKGRLKLIVSSSRRSIIEPIKPLRGRVLPVELFPLSLGEHLDFKGIKLEPTTANKGRLETTLDEHLKFGGFPEVVLARDETEKVSILGSYLNDIVGLDVAEVSGMPLTTVKAFAEYALQAPNFSASKTLTYLKTLGHKLGKDSILNLEHYTGASYLIHFIHIYSRNIKDHALYPRKAYPGDTGFNYALQGRVDLGRLYENVVLLELKRRRQVLEEINYWKNARGEEVDFIVRRGNRIINSIQVAYDINDEKTYKREVNSLARCAEELQSEHALIITQGDSREIRVNGVSIKIISLEDWLLQSFSISM